LDLGGKQQRCCAARRDRMDYAAARSPQLAGQSPQRHVSAWPSMNGTFAHEKKAPDYSGAF
jgi:hypothetical protein